MTALKVLYHGDIIPLGERENLELGAYEVGDFDQVLSDVNFVTTGVCNVDMRRLL